MQTIRGDRRASHFPSRFHLLAVMLAISPSCAPTLDRPPAPPSADVRAVAEDNNRFALDLYARLRAERSDNLFFSPASLSTPWR